MADPISINGRLIGEGHPVYVIAEMSANHNGDLERALNIVRAAKQAGADAIKIQLYTPDTMTLPLPQPPFLIEEGLWKGETLHDLYTRASTPYEWIDPLRNTAAAEHIDIFASVFSEKAVDIALNGLKAPALKIASFENVHYRFLNYAAMKASPDIPIILSTGMATKGEIFDACNALSAGHPEAQGALLHCNSGYPTPMEDANLRTIADIKSWFPGPVGFSDHTPGYLTPAIALAAGADIVEKHMKLDDGDCPDGAFSLTPKRFTEMVQHLNEVSDLMGEPAYGPTESEKVSIAFRRSIFVVRDTKKGQPLQLGVIRPGTGLHPRHWDELIGAPARHDVKAGTPMSWDLIE